MIREDITISMNVPHSLTWNSLTTLLKTGFTPVPFHRMSKTIVVLPPVNQNWNLCPQSLDTVILHHGSIKGHVAMPAPTAQPDYRSAEIVAIEAMYRLMRMLFSARCTRSCLLDFSSSQAASRFRSA